MFDIQKVEIVRANPPFAFGLFIALFGLAFRTLIVWWAVAVWFPEYGLTYWQLVLPVYAFRVLIGRHEFKRSFKLKSRDLSL